MKSRIAVLGLALMVASPAVVFAEVRDNESTKVEESQEVMGNTNEKNAKKEAKRLTKEGWEPSAGAQPLENQLLKSYNMRDETDDMGYPKYIIAEAQSVGQSYDAAKMQALELAKQNLAGQIQTEITSLVESSVSNNQLGGDEAASVVKTISASKNLISQSLGRVIPVMEYYRTLSNSNKEVVVSIAYNTDQAKAAAKRAVQNELQDETGNLHKKLDEILGW